MQSHYVQIPKDLNDMFPQLTLEAIMRRIWYAQPEKTKILCEKKAIVF